MNIDRLCVKLHKSLICGLEDPMTQHYGADDVIYDFYRARCRKLGMTPEEVSLRADTYMDQRREHRLRYKNPSRLNWKEQQSRRRQHECMFALMDEMAGIR